MRSRSGVRETGPLLGGGVALSLDSRVVYVVPDAHEEHLYRMRFVILLVAATAFAQSVFDPKSMDRSVEPCTDFYQYACGGWMKANPIPPDQTRWLRFSVLANQNTATLRGILESAAKTETKLPIDRKIGDAYAACTDEAGINTRGLDPIRRFLDRIAGISSRAGITQAVSELHAGGIGVLFRFGSQQDLKDSKMQIGGINPAGLGLPDREFYLRNDERSVKLRAAYAAHIAAMLKLAGRSAEQAESAAQRVLAFETTLAKSTQDRVAQREPKNSYHVYSIAELVSLAPGFNWQEYFKQQGAPEFGDMAKTLNVAYPPYFREVESQIVQASLDDWKSYLTWHLLRSSALRLPDAFVDEGFRFYGKTLSGQKENEPRWKRCVGDVNQSLRDLVGQKFIAATFGDDGKRRIDALVAEIRAALSRDIDSLAWMSPETKKEAHAKLAAVTQKIGYPETWEDYATVEIRRDDYFGNAARSAAFYRKKNIDQIGKPKNRKEWFIPVTTVDAFYSGQNNEIVFPAGILQPPFFDKNADDAVNYGSIGSVIGHEITHGFDDQGRKFDAEGDLRDWWTANDAQEYEERAQCIVAEYSKFESAGLSLNGKLTLGENTADNGGLRIALMGLMASLAKSGKPPGKIDGFTPEQRLFLAFGQTWCSNATDEVLKLLVATDPHSPGRWRVNGTVSNMPEFANAFACRVNQPMVRGPACRVW
ncbi:MAG: M13 family metallopeptidase [Bryobacteraceae bacterium]